MKIAIYPGSFDPATLGHLDIIERAAKLFDKLYVTIMVNGEKNPTFTTDEKIDLLKRMTAHLSNVEIHFFGGLLADYVRECKACVVVKGLRAVSDFEYEFQMALANKMLNSDLETVFLTTSSDYMYLSSGIVRDIATHGGDISKLVSPVVLSDIQKKFKIEG